MEVQVQEAQRVPNKLDSKRATPRHIIIKMPKVKDKERILKAIRKKKKVTYKGVSTRPSDNFSKQTIQARKDWQVLKIIKSKDIHPRLLHPKSYHLEWKGR